MELYLLKSTVCLAILYAIYILLLEKKHIHTFKRMYLIGIFFLAFGIPLITFTEYIEAIPKTVSLVSSGLQQERIGVLEIATVNYVPIILWLVYLLGLLFFSMKFAVNLRSVFKKVRNNPKHKKGKFTNVLLKDLIVPHTFFNYIFFNKNKFEKNEIPNEVLLHEESHAQQKHSLDILFIEFLQIIFWFNPILYLIKRAIKLNHEFLADQAVLDKGIVLSNYQKVLLSFSTNLEGPQLTNAINYSSIKKRFTVMKTQTSKKSLWLRSFVILPLLILLILGFSTTKQIVKKDIKPYEIEIHINKNKEISINDKSVEFNAISTELIALTKFDKKKFKVFVEVEGETTIEFMGKLAKEIGKANLKVDKFKAGYIQIETNKTDKFYSGTIFTADTITVKTGDGGLIKGVSGIPKKKEIEIRINREGNLFVDNEKHEIENLESKLKELTKGLSEREIENIFVHITSNEKEFRNLIQKVRNVLREAKITFVSYSTPQLRGKATLEEVKEYNKILKKFSRIPESQRIIKVKDFKRVKYIYSIMTAEQKKNSESFPKINTIPTPPPPAKIIKRVPKIIKVQKVKIVPPPPPPITSKVKNESSALIKAREAFSKEGDSYGKLVSNYLSTKKGNLSELKEHYAKVMKLYETYIKIVNKEQIKILPPPPPVPSK